MHCNRYHATSGVPGYELGIHRVLPMVGKGSDSLEQPTLVHNAILLNTVWVYFFYCRIFTVPGRYPGYCDMLEKALKLSSVPGFRGTYKYPGYPTGYPGTPCIRQRPWTPNSIIDLRYRYSYLPDLFRFPPENALAARDV
eukprot:944452-Rhodomonas_salina.3